MARRLTKLKITEVSSVDRGAGEGVDVVLMKKDPEMASEESSFVARLGKARDAFLASVKSILGDQTAVNKADLIDKTVDQFVEHAAKLSAADVVKALAEGTSADEPSEDEMTIAAMKKALGLADSATEQEVIATITKLAKSEQDEKDIEIAKLRKETADAQAALALAKAGFSNEELAFYNGLPDQVAKDAFLKADQPGRLAKMEKRGDLSELEKSLELEKAVARNTEYEKRIAKLEEEKELDGFKKQAVEIGLPESEGVTFMKAARGDKAAIAKKDGFLKSAIAAAKEGGLFKEFGATGQAGPMTAFEELTAKAAELRRAHPELTEAQAFSKVYTDPGNIKLAQKERLEASDAIR